MSRRVKDNDSESQKLRSENESQRREIETLRAQLEEAQETLRAIHEGEVDALLVKGPEGDRIFTLQSAEQPYRVLIEQMREGAVTLVHDGTIHYANRAFAEMVKRPLELVIGSPVRDYVAEADRSLYDALMQQCLTGSARGELSLMAADGCLLPAYLSLSMLVVNGVCSICMVITDLTEQKRSEQILASERYSRAILNQAADAIMVCDAQGQLTFVNAAARRLVKLDPASTTLQIAPELWGKAFDPNGRSLAAKDWPLTLALRGQATTAQEIRLVRGDGGSNDLLISASPLREADGSILGAVATFTDITSRKAAEQAVQRQNEELQGALEELRAVEEELRTQNDELAMSQQNLQAQQQRYEGLFQFAPDAYLSTDLEGTIREANRAAMALLNVDAKALIGVPLGLYVAPEARDEYESHLRRLGQPQARLECELVLQPHRRPAFPAALTVAAIEEGQGHPRGCRWLIRDITDRRRVEQEIQEARQLAERASAAKDQFIAVLSHELRTPLMPVLTAAQMLEADAKLPPELRESVAMIRRNAELETRLIDDLLDLTRIARGKLELHFAPKDGHEKIRHVVEICQQELREKQQELTLQLNAARHHVQADGARLQQVLWNLLKNAIKFTPVGGSIRIRTSNAVEGRLSIEVIDTGVGIEPEILPRLFTAFEQGGRDVTRQFGGLGLGLSISKAIVEMHGGSLSAHSAGRGRGATFTLFLPLSAQTEAVRATPAPRAASSKGKAGRILLVEDHADTRRIMVQLLGGCGHRVQAADSVASALQVAQAEPFDLLISDIGLPDGSGLELMRQLSQMYPLKGIALSGYGMEEDLRKSREAGFVEHLVKPLNIAQFESTIARLLSDGDDGPNDE